MLQIKVLPLRKSKTYSTMQLKPDTFLQGGKYRIEKVLGHGSFGSNSKSRHKNGFYRLATGILSFFVLFFVCKGPAKSSNDEVVLLEVAKQEFLTCTHILACQIFMQPVINNHYELYLF